MLKKALIFATLFLTLGCSSQKSADLLADATVALDGASSAKDCAAETYALARKALGYYQHYTPQI